VGPGVSHTRLVQRQRYGPRFRPEGGPQAAAKTLPTCSKRMRISPQTHGFVARDASSTPGHIRAEPEHTSVHVPTDHLLTLGSKQHSAVLGPNFRAVAHASVSTRLRTFFPYRSLATRDWHSYRRSEGQLSGPFRSVVGTSRRSPMICAVAWMEKRSSSSTDA